MQAKFLLHFHILEPAYVHAFYSDINIDLDNKVENVLYNKIDNNIDN